MGKKKFLIFQNIFLFLNYFRCRLEIFSVFVFNSCHFSCKQVIFPFYGKLFFNSIYLLEYKIFMQALDLRACTASEPMYTMHIQTSLCQKFILWFLCIDKLTLTDTQEGLAVYHRSFKMSDQFLGMFNRNSSSQEKKVLSL